MAKVILTPSQQAVVEHSGSALLVSAAAGSGKTKVLVDRLLRQVCDPVSPCNVDDFLIITYTKAAAADLRRKIAAEIGERLAAQPENRHLRNQLVRLYLAEISTVHSFCAGILRSHAHLLDIPADFRVIEESENISLQMTALEQVLAGSYDSLHKDASLQALFEGLGYGRNDRRLKKLVLSVYSSIQCHPDPKAWIDSCREELTLSEENHISETIWGKYLLTDMQEFLSQQIIRMEAAVTLLSACPVLETYRPVFSDNLEFLKSLRQNGSWEYYAQNAEFDFGRLSGARNCTRPDIQEQVKNIRDTCKKHLKMRMTRFSADAESALDELMKTRKPLLGLLRLAEDFDRKFTQMKRQRRVLDFADLEHCAICLLTDRYTGKPTAAAREISARFREIMVDEYQDSNAVQDTIFRAVSREGKNLFMVGDVKQSIYRFRLADPGIFLEKYHTFSLREACDSDQPRKILLSENFRSRREILDAVNHVCTTVMSDQVGDLHYGEEEALRTMRQFPDLGESAVELHCINTDVEGDGEESAGKSEAEAHFVANKIRSLIDGEHFISDGDGLRRIREEDIVIIMRALTAAPVFRRVLAEYGISCVSDRSDSILETTEVSTVLAWLQIVDNPHQDIALVTAMAGPVGGFTADELAQIRVGSRREDLYDALCRAARDQEKFAAFLSVLNDLREKRLWMMPSEFYDYISTTLQTENIFGAMTDGGRRLQNLGMLRNLCVTAENIGIRDLSGFLDYTESLRESGAKFSAPVNAASGVTILSTHKSKGLEFPVVFLCDLSRNFNMDDLYLPVLTDSELKIGCNVVDRELMVQYPSPGKNAIALKKRRDSISEELRVLYVAMTRARDRLIMTYCHGSLENHIQKITMDASAPAQPCIAAAVSNPGQWILLSAAVRPEAGHIFGGCEKQDDLPGAPWLVQYHETISRNASVSCLSGTEERTAEVPDTVCLNTAYSWLPAVEIPAKMTATQLKGRVLDTEAAESAAPMKFQRQSKVSQRVFQPGDRVLTPAQKGTATHLFMQYCDYAACRTPEGIEREKQRLLIRQYLLPEQVEAVESAVIQRFFDSPLGKLVTGPGQICREVKFSLMTDAAEYDAAADGEKIMLQGVVDCFVIRDGQITVLDYKTDRIRPGQEEERTQMYRPQLMAYRSALERIYGLPVTSCCIYYFATGEYCEVI